MISMQRMNLARQLFIEGNTRIVRLMMDNANDYNIKLNEVEIMMVEVDMSLLNSVE